MEERRLLLAVALSLLVLTAYQFFLAPPPAPKPAASPSPAAPKAAPSPQPGALPAESPEPGPASVPTVADTRERRIEVTGPDVMAAFTNRGARLVSWRLARFKDARDRPEEMVQSVLGGP